METINIQQIPKGQKVVIRTRPNGNKEILIRPDLEMEEAGNWIFWIIGIACIVLVFVYHVNNSSETMSTPQPPVQTETSGF